MEYKDWFSLIWVGAGIIFAVAVCFWNLTFERKKRDDEKEFMTIKDQIKEIKESASKEKEANEKFRHKHESSVSSLCLLMEEKFKNLDAHLQGLKDFFALKITNAILNAKHNDSHEKD